ncbi:MAG: XdhC family protein [Verrucomicrobiales bacterium]|nr:XdhC family protein [Verrucomicrobiales bacterium]
MTSQTESAAWCSTVLRLIESGRGFAVVTVLQAEGSTPVPAGAKAAIERDGTIHGTVGGGAVEAEARRRAMAAARSGSPAVFDFTLRGSSVRAARPICGGAMRLLVDPRVANHVADYRRAAAALARRERGMWITTLRRTDRIEVGTRHLPGRELVGHEGFLDAAVLEACLKAETPRLLPASSEPGLEVFIEPLVPQPVLIIVGGGHVGQAVAAQAAGVGFELRILDDRPDFADARRFPPGARTHSGDVAAQLAAMPVDRDTFIVIVTRGHQQDVEALRACIRRPAAYLGMIGSRRKVPLIRRRFLASGWATATEFDRVHAPIGLDIGAVTVPEIAASIVAQLIAVRRLGAASRITKEAA